MSLPRTNSVDWAAQRARMVDGQLRARGIEDPRVLEAMARIPREEFLPERFRAESYADEPVSIGWNQTISQPYIVALMAACLELKGEETVLEVGCGSGYHAAVLGALAAQVVAVEILPELAALAQANLERTGRAANVHIVVADGSHGYEALAPPTTRSRWRPRRPRRPRRFSTNSKTRDGWSFRWETWSTRISCYCANPARARIRAS